jgi:hypothetical protein
MLSNELLQEMTATSTPSRAQQPQTATSGKCRIAHRLPLMPSRLGQPPPQFRLQLAHRARSPLRESTACAVHNPGRRGACQGGNRCRSVNAAARERCRDGSSSADCWLHCGKPNSHGICHALDSHAAVIPCWLGWWCLRCSPGTGSSAVAPQGPTPGALAAPAGEPVLQAPTAVPAPVQKLGASKKQPVK